MQWLAQEPGGKRRSDPAAIAMPMRAWAARGLRGCLSPVASPSQCCLPRMPSRAPPAQASVSLPRVGSAEALRFQGKYEESRDGLDCAAVFDGGAFRLHLVSASLKTLRCAGVGKGGGKRLGLLLVRGDRLCMWAPHRAPPPAMTATELACTATQLAKCTERRRERRRFASRRIPP